MKYKVVFVFLILVVFFLNLLKKPSVYYTPINIPGEQMAITIPPFGILIEKKFEFEGSRKGSILSHEKIHWVQYKKLGLFGFYYNYLSGYVKYGRKYSPMEREARRLSTSHN
jgi:hypothetical protein